jgi:hypothetical protein
MLLTRTQLHAEAVLDSGHKRNLKLNFKVGNRDILSKFTYGIQILLGNILSVKYRIR